MEKIVYVVTMCDEVTNYSRVYDNRKDALARYYSDVSYAVTRHGDCFAFKDNGLSTKECRWACGTSVVLSTGIE